MIKRFALALAALLFAAPAAAQEINPDTGMDTPGSWMAETGWSVTGSKGVATSAISMKMLMQMNTAIKEGTRYKITFTVSNYTGSGEVRAFAGVSMPTAPTGSYITAASVSDVADNFTTSNGVLTTATPKASLTGPGDSAEGVGSFRFACGPGKFGWVDPLVYPGTNSAHLHGFAGNNGVQKDWSFNDFRTKGSTTCGEPQTSKGKLYPLNRSGYWYPAVLDGKGNAITPSSVQLYYKRAPTDAYDGDALAHLCADESPTNDCRGFPTGIRIVSGYKASDGTCGPADASCTGLGGSQFMGFDCWNSGGQSVKYATLAALKAANICTVKGTDQVRAFIDFPPCWDGVNVDSPNHRDHMKYMGSGVCPPTHPVVIPFIGVMVFLPVDQAFLDGKWRLASDEMVNGAAAGTTLHFDYFEAWSPTIRARWLSKCIEAHNSCSGGDLGDTTSIGVPLNYDGSSAGCLSCTIARPDRYVPTSKHGMSKSYLANGTYSVELTSVGSGVWGFMGLNGFSGSIDNVSVTKLSTGKGPVTVTGSGG